MENKEDKTDVPDSSSASSSGNGEGILSSSQEGGENGGTTTSSLNALIATLHQQQQLRQQQQQQSSVTTTAMNDVARSSAFTATSHSWEMGNGGSGSAGGTAPVTKRIRRSSHAHRSAAPSAASTLDASAKSADVGSAASGMDYVTHIQRLYQATLLNNLLMSNPEMLMRLQQLNALQQAFSPNPFLPAASTDNMLLLNNAQKLSSSVLNSAAQMGTNPTAASLSALLGANPSMSMLNSLMGHMAGGTDATVAAALGSNLVRPQTSASGGNETWSGGGSAKLDLFNALMQRQYACALSGAAQQQHAPSRAAGNNTQLPVVVNGQDGVDVPSSSATGKHSTIADKHLHAKRLQQIPIGRQALEARFARILAQELEASDEEHDLRLKANADEEMDVECGGLSDMERKTSSGTSPMVEACASGSASPGEQVKADSNDVPITTSSSISSPSPGQVVESDAPEQCDSAPTMVASQS